MSGLSRRRGTRLAIVILLGVVLGAGGFLALRVATAPGPRWAPGWELLAELPSPRGETATAVDGGLVYVAGGFTGLGFETTDLVSVSDAAANAWREGPSLPEPRNHAAATALAGIVFVSGGAGPSGAATDSFWALAEDGRWERLEPMPGARSGHRMVTVGELIYVVGGNGGPADGPGAAGRTLIFDPTSNAWRAGAPLPVNRDHLAAVVVDDEIWAIGGRAAGRNHALVDIYNPITDTWRAGPALPEATSGAAEAILDGVIYVSGGEDPARGVIVDRHWRLDTGLGASAAWEPLTPPPLAIHGVAGAAIDGRIVIIGGSTRPGGESNTAWTGATQAFAP